MKIKALQIGRKFLKPTLIFGGAILCIGIGIVGNTFYHLRAQNNLMLPIEVYTAPSLFSSANVALSNFEQEPTPEAMLHAAWALNNAVWLVSNKNSYKRESFYPKTEYVGQFLLAMDKVNWRSTIGVPKLHEKTCNDDNVINCWFEASNDKKNYSPPSRIAVESTIKQLEQLKIHHLLTLATSNVVHENFDRSAPRSYFYQNHPTLYALNRFTAKLFGQYF